MGDWLSSFYSFLSGNGGNVKRATNFTNNYVTAKETSKKFTNNYKTSSKTLSSEFAQGYKNGTSKNNSYGNSGKSGSGSSGSGGGGGSSGSGGSGGSSGSGGTTSNAVVEDVTGNAIKSQKLEPIENKFNDLTPSWSDTNEGWKQSSSRPDVHIFISYEKYQENSEQKETGELNE